MKIKTIKVHAVLGVKDMNADLKGHHVWMVGGGNGSGKTSVLDSIVLAICGPRGCDYPDQPLMNGEDEGWVIVEIEGSNDFFQDGLTVERRFTREGDTVKEQLRLLGDDGFLAPTPQTLLNELYENRGFDPMAFVRLKRKDQANELRKFIGIDFTGLDVKRDECYAKRTVFNRQAKEFKSQISELSYDETVTEEVDIAELSKAITDAIVHNQRKDSLELVVTKLEESYSDQNKEISRCEESIESLREQIKNCEHEISERKNTVEEIESGLSKAKKDVEEFELIGLAPMQDELASASEINKTFHNNASYLKVKSQFENAVDNSDKLTAAIEKIDATKEKALVEADWPVEGMAFSEDGGITVGNVPFDQCSKAEQITVSVKMAMSANPRLKMMVIQHGECMDNKSLQLIHEMAEEDDYQLLVEYMTRDELDEERCQIVMEDGSIKAVSKQDEK